MTWIRMASRASGSRRPSRGTNLAASAVLVLLALAAAQAVSSPRLALAATERLAAGRLIVASGDVRILTEGKEPAVEAKPPVELFVGDVVRTGESGRAALLLLDGSQVKLNSDTTIEIRAVAPMEPLVGVEKASAYEKAKTTLLRLIRGESWIRSRGAGGRLQIETPVASATIRGTEFDVVHTEPQKETIATVVEGRIELANDKGAVEIGQGERGRARPGQAPTKEVILNPEDAVQWSLYYPAQVSLKDMPLAGNEPPETRRAWDAIAARDYSDALTTLAGIKRPDESADLARAVALQSLGRTGEARTYLEKTALARYPASSRLLWRLALIELLSGEAAAARIHLEKAAGMNPKDWVPPCLLSTVALTQNRKDEALSQARRAVEINPAVPSTHVALGLALQSRFDLDGAQEEFEKAVAADPRDVAALLYLARVLFGKGLAAESLERLTAARAIDPEEPLVHSLLGFVELAGGKTALAEDSFRRAATGSGATLAEPQLGLGLCAFREGRPADGLLAMLSATLLEPRVSLYQSYLGKAYYEVRETAQAYTALDDAGSLDPRDPTPHLYKGLILRENYRPAEAIEEFRKSATLNDNRAVYRSRSLLDEDMAVRNVSQAQSYRDIGFEAWGMSRALRAVEEDPTSSEAHLFLLDNYLNQPDRTTAAGSELIQTQLLLPVNENTFNTFNDYTSFFEGPRTRFVVKGTAGDYETGMLDLVAQGAAGDIAYNAILSGLHQGGLRDVENPLVQGQAAAFSKYSLGSSGSLLLDLSFLDTSYGEVDSQESRPLNKYPPGKEPETAANWLNPTDLDLRYVNQITTFRGQVGSYVVLNNESNFLALASGSTYDRQSDNLSPDWKAGSALVEERVRETEGYGRVQGQYNLNLWKNHFYLGAEGRYAESSFSIRSSYYDAATDALDRQLSLFDSNPWLFSLYAGDGWQITDWLYLAGGVRLDLFNNFVLYAGEKERQTVKPFAGFRVGITDSTWLRGAYIEAVETHFDPRISPAEIAGFPIYLNQFLGSERQEFDLSVEQEIGGSGYVTVFGYWRDLDIPVPFRPSEPAGAEYRIVRSEEKYWSVGGQWNQILTGRLPVLGGALTLAAEARYERGDTNAFDVANQIYSAALNAVHPDGWFFRFGGRYLRQSFADPNVYYYGVPVVLPQDDPVLLDVSLARELFQKRLRISADVTNLLDQKFQMILGGTSLHEDLEPVRNFRVTVRATF